jgi:hypothetical protein
VTPVADTAYGHIATNEVEAAEVRLVGQDTETAVRSYFSDIPVMIQIARCESNFRQYNDAGEVLKNTRSSAKGVFQIMESLHEDPAQKLGYDITTLEGNMAYARDLYERQGTRPWTASSACWNKSDTIAMR